MLRGVIENGTATAARSLGVPLAGKTGTVNDHTDVWFIGYTPTYVTGVWMGYPGRKKNLGNDMTGGGGALPFFIDFMKDFLKGKPKEDFEKPPAMPEDMKELQKQRQREMMEERAELYALRGASRSGEKSAEGELPTAITTPKLEQVTLPPAPRTSDDEPSGPSTPTSDTLPKKSDPAPARADPPPPAATTRPREVEPAKKKGKKGNDEP
jgi:penicillin-binding protein 1A